MTCVNMKKTTLQSVYDALTGAGGAVIQLDEELRKKALGSIRICWLTADNTEQKRERRCTFQRMEK